MEVINLNFIPSGASPVAHASQFDEGRTTRFNLFDGASVFTLDGTETLSVSVRKPDGHIVTEAVTNTSSNYVEVVTTEQMTACAGENLAQIKVEKGGDTIGFLNYILAVQKDPEDGGDPSESFIHDLNQQIYDAVADQYDSNAVIFDNAPTPGHGVGYVVTSEGTPDELNDLTDVDIAGQAIGEALVWDGSKWVNGTVSTVGSIDDLNDVDTTGKQNGDSLRYNSGASEWEAAPVVIACTQAEYDQMALDGDLKPMTYYIITDAPNITATAGDIPLGSDFSDPTSTAGAVGDLSTLTTTDKSSLVGAVNEVNKKESETLTYTSGANTASFTFNRFGNMICVIGSGGAMPLPTSWTNLTGTLSANFRPTTALSLALITGDNHLIFLEINTNGTVRVYSNYAGNLYPSGTGIYVTT